MAKAILSRTNDHDVKHNFSLRTRPSHTALQRRKGDPYLGAPISVAAKSQGLEQIKYVVYTKSNLGPGWNLV